MSNKNQIKEIVEAIYHFKVEDKASWSFCAEILKQNYDIQITETMLEDLFHNFFKDNFGAKPYTACPICKGELYPRKSRYGFFLGCSNFPDCSFIATKQNPIK